MACIRCRNALHIMSLTWGETWEMGRFSSWRRGDVCRDVQMTLVCKWLTNDKWLLRCLCASGGQSVFYSCPCTAFWLCNHSLFQDSKVWDWTLSTETGLQSLTAECEPSGSLDLSSIDHVWDQLGCAGDVSCNGHKFRSHNIQCVTATFRTDETSACVLLLLPSLNGGGIARGPIEAIRRPHYLFSNVPEGFLQAHSWIP